MATKIANDVNRIRKSAEKMNAAKPERIGSPSLGDVVRQGDIYLVCVDQVGGQQTTNMQLAPGETQGSRHILLGDCRVFTQHGIEIAGVPRGLIGPAFKCGDEVTVTHPEHGHKILPAETSWVVVYQRSWAEEIRRVQD